MFAQILDDLKSYVATIDYNTLSDEIPTAILMTGKYKIFGNHGGNVFLKISEHFFSNFLLREQTFCKYLKSAEFFQKSLLIILYIYSIFICRFVHIFLYLYPLQ